MKSRIAITILILGFIFLFFNKKDTEFKPTISDDPNDYQSITISDDPNDYQSITITVGDEKTLKFNFGLENTASIIYIQEADRSKDASYKLDSASKEKIQKIICDYCKVIERKKHDYWPSTDEYEAMFVLWEVNFRNEDGLFSYRKSGALCYPDDWEEFLESIEAYLQ